MTVSSATNRNDYIGDNSTDTFSYSFRIFANTDLLVTQKDLNDVETTLVLTSDYTVTGVGDVAGGTIVLTAGNLATDFTLTIRRVIPLTQITDLRNQGSYFPENVEDQFDKHTMVDQQQQDILDRSIFLPESIPPADFNGTMPTTLTASAGKPIIVNDDGDGWDMGPTQGEIAAAEANAASAAVSAASAVSNLTSNMKITLSAGILTITGADGNPLSDTNPGFVVVPSVTGGDMKSLKVSSDYLFHDDAHASSDLTNLGFGLTETVDWAEDVPFFIGVINRADSELNGTDGNSTFFITKNLIMRTSPSAADDIGDTTAIPVNDSADVILIMGDNYTQANYVSLPTQITGAFRMQWVTSTDDWTVQTLENSDGIGATQIQRTSDRVYTMPKGQNGALASEFLGSTGVVPTWATPANVVYTYQINLEGWVSVNLQTNNAGAANETGQADVLSMVVPYPTDSILYSQTNGPQSPIYIRETGGGDGIHWARLNSGVTLLLLSDPSGAGSLLESDFSDGLDDLEIVLSYKAY